MPFVILVLLVVGLVFGLGVVVYSRSTSRRAVVDLEPPARTTAHAAHTVVAPPAPVEPDVVEPDVVEPEVIERPRVRDRLGKARAALVAAFTGVRSRSGVDDDTWDDLEEALLRSLRLL